MCIRDSIKWAASVACMSVGLPRFSSSFFSSGRVGGSGEYHSWTSSHARSTPLHAAPHATDDDSRQIFIADGRRLQHWLVSDRVIVDSGCAVESIKMQTTENGQRGRERERCIDISNASWTTATSSTVVFVCVCVFVTATAGLHTPTRPLPSS